MASNAPNRKILNAAAAGIEYLAAGLGALRASVRRQPSANAVNAGADYLAGGLASFATIPVEVDAPRPMRRPGAHGRVNAPLGLGVPG